MFTRRNFLQTTGLAGVLALAGCIASGKPRQGKKLDVEPSYGGWFDGVSNYDGTDDFRGRTDVTVDVGAKGSLGYYKFSPAAIAVSPGTTVTWRWTGKGGSHDVRAESGAFRSGDLAAETGHTFSHTFDSPGVFKYYCTPHKSMGMRGAVFVALDEPQDVRS